MMPGAVPTTILLLLFSNAFMLTAWYLHLKSLADRPWWIAALASWLIAFVEYLFHIPANRIGNTVMSLAELQILQVGMSLLLFMPFAVFVMDRPMRWDYVWASFCLTGAAFFIFRGTPAT